MTPDQVQVVVEVVVRLHLDQVDQIGIVSRVYAAVIDGYGRIALAVDDDSRGCRRHALQIPEPV